MWRLAAYQSASYTNNLYMMCEITNLEIILEANLAKTNDIVALLKHIADSLIISMATIV